MRHVIVTRVVACVTALCVAAVVASTWAATRRGGGKEHAEASKEGGAKGSELFLRHCAACHEPEETGVAFRAGPDQEAARKELGLFLHDHHGPSPEGSALIAAYLVGQ